MRTRRMRTLIGANGKKVRTDAVTADEILTDVIQHGLTLPVHERTAWGPKVFGLKRGGKR